LKSARRRRAIEVAGPRSQKERGQRTQGGQSITAWRGCQRTKRAGKALFVSALTRANPLITEKFEPQNVSYTYNSIIVGILKT
jgi:hypothetical protein